MHYSSRRNRRSRLLAGTAILGLTVMLGAAHAQAGSDFDISAQPLPKALAQFGAQSGFEIIADSMLTASKRSVGVSGNVDPDVALSRILRGTGLTYRRDDGSYVIIAATMAPREVAQTTPARAAAAAGIESVVVTSSKIKGDIQTVPIAITALSQEQLTSRQIAGGPDLVKEVPNLTFTKTNFTGYSIQIRGIGTQAISVATDPAVAVALNDIPFIRNHFFEQEFYDLNQAEVLRGPQGTLYGRNATAGVVNLVSAKPTDQFEAMVSADWGNFTNRRYEAMVNIPIIDDRVDLRIAGEWTKREGYTTNDVTGSQVDGRDLWSTRVTLGWKPVENMQAYLVWEHFQESDDRMRTSKQLCHRDGGPLTVLGAPTIDPQTVGDFEYLAFTIHRGYLSQGCLPASMYSVDSFQVPYGYSLPYVEAGYAASKPEYSGGGLNASIDPYASTVQSQNLRAIETQIDPRYRAKNDTLELNVDYNVTPSLTFTSQTGYNNDFLWSTEDYNRFNTTADIFNTMVCHNSSSGCSASAPLRLNSLIVPDGNYRCFDGTLSIGGTQGCNAGGLIRATGEFCDPQLGCSSRLVVQDLSKERAWQLSQEFRLASNFTGPLNFSVGGNYMHYETVENYYVFANSLTMYAASLGAMIGPSAMPSPDSPWIQNVTDNSLCLPREFESAEGTNLYHDPASGGGGIAQCYYIDPNPLGSLNDKGHSYFLSQNPYVLNSYAGFGEAYYDVTHDLKLTGGIRWTDDKKHFIDIPSELLTTGLGYGSTGAVNQQWNQLTGRLAANWSPKLDFTDQTLLYGSFAHGYKAGGANPPSAVVTDAGPTDVAVHPLTFKPEFVDAYELGTKNTLMDGGLTLNGDVFFYNYEGYQISRIVDRTAINDNFNATVKGAEVEASYEPLPGLKFNFAGGYEDTRIKDGQSSVDLIDRTDSANHPNWMVMKPFITHPSNCIFPDYVVKALLITPGLGGIGGRGVSACSAAYLGDTTDDPVTGQAYSPYPYAPGGSHYCPSCSADVQAYPGYDPTPVDATHPYNYQNTFNGVDYGPAPNNGEGFAKDLSGNQLPNAPHFTVSLGGEYTMPVSEDWAATLHSDFYWQSQSFARVFNDRPYDKIRGYSNVNLALILTSAEGWQVMGYLKNAFDTTAITGTFLNSDDSGLTTNIFLTDPRLYGVRVTKNW